MKLTEEERTRMAELQARRAYPGLFKDEQHELNFLEAMSRSKAPTKKVESEGKGVDGRITEEGRRFIYRRK